MAHHGSGWTPIELETLDAKFLSSRTSGTAFPHDSAGDVTRCRLRRYEGSACSMQGEKQDMLH
ncbi:uncharacterized protein N7515_010087 [Penicillium bovifimosum]|uniref:Uncharacterized protein n=1 Tax=Penicillium bovifimosum TaxID=126998 RepID=A0A9W9KUY2_9EURO|nr:uncharacterized protein N7515_010087 [Penicillium bovifimosum]KAJ5120699.1 hypothetical protein N7515_010087 [Penicillium bovifimosum]